MAMNFLHEMTMWKRPKLQHLTVLTPQHFTQTKEFYRNVKGKLKGNIISLKASEVRSFKS